MLFRSSMWSDPWGALKDYGDDIKSAAISLKEDPLHPLEVMQSIINRARSGHFPGGSDVSRITSAPLQYEPMNRKYRGTERDPRTVNPQDPKVQELAQKYHELRAGNIDTGIGNATNFLNPDIVRGRRHLHGYEQKALNDPSSTRVDKHLFYTPAGAMDDVTPTPPRRPGSFESPSITPDQKGDYFSRIKPPIRRQILRGDLKLRRCDVSLSLADIPRHHANDDALLPKDRNREQENRRDRKSTRLNSSH